MTVYTRECRVGRCLAIIKCNGIRSLQYVCAVAIRKKGAVEWRAVNACATQSKFNDSLELQFVVCLTKRQTVPVLCFCAVLCFQPSSHKSDFVYFCNARLRLAAADVDGRPCGTRECHEKNAQLRRGLVGWLYTHLSTMLCFRFRRMLFNLDGN